MFRVIIDQYFSSTIVLLVLLLFLEMYLILSSFLFLPFLPLFFDTFYLCSRGLPDVFNAFLKHSEFPYVLLFKFSFRDITFICFA